eukprot:510820_1
MLRKISRLSTIASFGVIYSSYHYPFTLCEKQKYHAWNNTWKRHRNNKTIPPWDPGMPTTATKFLDVMEPTYNNKNYKTNQINKLLIPLCGASYDMEYIQQYFMNKYNNIDTKIIGIEMSTDAIKLFLERVTKNNKETLDSYWITYDHNIPIYRYKNYYLIQADIFNESLP